MSLKKISQNDLRRIMSEQKKKLLEKVKKIESPLAKYKEDGQLMCILCDHNVRSEAVWNVHINSKQHKENISRRKQEQFVKPLEPLPVAKTAQKRSLVSDSYVAPKKLKGILKNAPQPQLPEGFFDSEERLKPLTELSPSGTPTLPLESQGEDEDEMEAEDEAVEAKETLPEGFFDDPVLDAKARHVEYKDPIQEEWDRFQKEIKEETTVSTQIIEDDQEEATAERQIQEIDEQMRNWSRVLDLEVKKEKVQAVVTRSVAEEMDQVSSDEENEFDEFLDWRAKKSFK